MSTSEKLIENFPHLFPRVELANSSDVFNGATFNEWEQKAIIIHKPEGGIHVGGLASNKYSLHKNEDIFLPIADKIDSMFGEKNVKVRLKNSKPFEYHLYFEIPSEKTNAIDALYPMSSVTNSYTTQVKASQFGMIGRVICGNGLVSISEKANIFDIKHTKDNVLDIPQILIDTEKVYKDFGVYTSHIDTMNNVKLSTIKGDNNLERLKSIVSGTNFPVKQIETAFNLAQKEAAQLKQNVTLWLAYNAFNHILWHDTTSSMTEKMKIELDGKLVNKAHNLALQYS